MHLTTQTPGCRNYEVEFNGRPADATLLIEANEEEGYIVMLRADTTKSVKPGMLPFYQRDENFKSVTDMIYGHVKVVLKATAEVS